MGFFGNLIRNQVEKMVSNAVDDVVDNTVGSALRNAFGQNGREGTQNFSDNSRSAAKRNGAASGEKLLRQRLEEVFAEEFAGYEVRKDLQYECGLFKGCPHNSGFCLRGKTFPG